MLLREQEPNRKLSSSWSIYRATSLTLSLFKTNLGQGGLPLGVQGLGQIL